MPAKLMMGMVGISPFMVKRTPSPTLRVVWGSTTHSLMYAQFVFSCLHGNIQTENKHEKKRELLDNLQMKVEKMH
jgi:hypothetical protein